MVHSRNGTPRRWLALAALGLALVGAACDEMSGGSANPSVSVQDDYFSPAQLTVSINSTVTFVWGGARTHNVTYVAGPTPLPPNSSTVASGIFLTSFTMAGTYDYLCTLHPGMDGRVIVTP